jgi:hypothetical protein
MFLGGWMGGWMDGWVVVKAILRIAYSNQKLDQNLNKMVYATRPFKNRTNISGFLNGQALGSPVPSIVDHSGAG